MPNVILYRRIIDDGKFHKDNETALSKVRQRIRKERKNATISALSSALRQRLS